MVSRSAIRTLIELALFDHMEKLPFGASPKLPFAWPNIDFTPPDDSKYIEVIHLPNVPTDYALSNDTVGIHQGFLQANVRWVPNVGTIEPNHIAGLIAEHFRKGTRVITSEFNIRIYSHPTIAALVRANSRENNPQPFVPVSIPYRTETI